MWSSNLAVDLGRGAVYVDTGNNYSVPGTVSTCQRATKTNKQLEARLDPQDHTDSILSLDIDSGAVKWAQRFTFQDTAIDTCVNVIPDPVTPCPIPHGEDTDFGSAPNLFTAEVKGTERNLVGAGQKSGVCWAMDRDTGNIVWATQVGAGGR